MNDFYLRDRMMKIENAEGREIPKGFLRVIRLKGCETDIGKLTERLLRDIKTSEPSLIIIDPIYMLMGEDMEENSNDSIQKFFKYIHEITEKNGGFVSVRSPLLKG